MRSSAFQRKGLLPTAVQPVNFPRIVELSQPFVRKGHPATSLKEELAAAIPKPRPAFSCPTLRLPSIPRSQQLGLQFQALPTSHPAFGQQQEEAIVTAQKRPKKTKGNLLSTAHPAFGQKKASQKTACAGFEGPVAVSGWFVSLDWNWCVEGKEDRMNPTAHLTVRDTRNGEQVSRVRYKCILEADKGVKFEALLRFQVGWIAPKATFTTFPHRIALGKGFDLSIPFILHLTMVNVLDENGCATGSCLYFSGTPWLGFSAGLVRIAGGELLLDNDKEIDPKIDCAEFVKGKVHYRQVGFVAFKLLSYLVSVVLLFVPFVKMKNLAISLWTDAQLRCPKGQDAIWQVQDCAASGDI